jgi:uncharacterized protein (DUF433 family)
VDINPVDSSTMALQTTEYKYISLGSDDVPYIAGTTMKVVELVTSHLTYGWSPAELHFQYPHISLSQVYSALAYYWDHKTEIEADMQRRLELAQTLKAASASPIVAKFKLWRNRSTIELKPIMYQEHDTSSNQTSYRQDYHPNPAPPLAAQSPGETHASDANLNQA